MVYFLYVFSAYDKYSRPNKKESILHFHEFHNLVCVNRVQHEEVRLTTRGNALGGASQTHTSSYPLLLLCSINRSPSFPVTLFVNIKEIYNFL